MSSGRIDAPALSFLFSFFTSETSEADSTSEYYACYGSSYLVGVCVCARVHVSCTRERDIRAYVRVALICAHFTIIVRDRIVVGWPWRLCPALLRQLFCYSDGVRVFVLNGAHHLSPRHVIRFSWSVPPERVTTLKVTRPRQPRRFNTRFLFFERDVRVSSPLFDSKGAGMKSFRKERKRFKTIKTCALFSTGSGLNRVIPALCLISVESVDAGSGHRGVAKVTREELRSSLHLCCAANS